MSKWWSSSACSCCWDLVFFWQTTLWPLELKSICYFASSIINVVFTSRQQNFQNVMYAHTKCDIVYDQLVSASRNLMNFVAWSMIVSGLFFYLHKNGLQEIVWNCFILMYLHSESIPETALTCMYVCENLIYSTENHCDQKIPTGNGSNGYQNHALHIIKAYLHWGQLRPLPIDVSKW